GPGALLRPVVFLQCFLRGFWRADAGDRDLVSGGQSDGPCVVSCIHRRADLRAWPLPDGPQRPARRRDRPDGTTDRNRGSTGKLMKRAAKAALLISIRESSA